MMREPATQRLAACAWITKLIWLERQHRLSLRRRLAVPADPSRAARAAGKRLRDAPARRAGRPERPCRAASTTMRSKLRTVESRCAMAMTVRPCIRRPNASRIASSDSLSSADVASSSKSSGAFLRNARAMAMRWRWPPERRTPRSPTSVRMPFGRCFDEVAARRERRVEHFFVRSVRPAVADILHDRAMEQGNVLRHDADGFAQAFLRDAGDVLTVDQNAAVLHVVETLQQREQSRFTAAGRANEADAFARHEAQVQVLENLLAVAVAEIDVLEPDAGAAPDQRRRLRMIAQLVRHQQRRQRLRQARDMLRDVDERHREIARGVQHRNGRACRSARRRRWSLRSAATA